MKLNIDIFIENVIDISVGYSAPNQRYVEIYSSLKNLEWIVLNIYKQNEVFKPQSKIQILPNDFSKPALQNELNPDACEFIGPNGVRMKFIEQQELRDIIKLICTIETVKRIHEFSFNDLLLKEE